MERCLLVFGETKAQEEWSYATDNNPGKQKQLFLPQVRSGLLERKKGVAEETQVNFLKRCELINYERIGKSPRINGIHEKKNSKHKIKTHDQNIYDSKKKKKR